MLRQPVKEGKKIVKDQMAISFKVEAKEKLKIDFFFDRVMFQQVQEEIRTRTQIKDDVIHDRWV